MKSRRADNLILCLLTIVFVAQVLLLLWHLDIISFTDTNRNYAATGTAGTITKSQNHLKRRSLNSLVWEDSHSKDSIFYHDSMLTLSHSTATLKLENGTEIHLSENTLVTVEPPDHNRQSEIRLRFTKGNLKTRNTFSKSKIKAESFVVDLEKDSEVSLHQIGKNNFQVNLVRGTASIVSPRGRQNISKEEIIRINGEGSHRYQKNSLLIWERSKPKRTYTHKKFIETEFSWKGQAHSIMLQKSGEDEKVIELDKNQQKFKTQLSLGSYRLYLKSEKGLSKSLEVDVWRAPVIHLLEPLPRNRVLFSDTKFLWTPYNEASSYVIKLNGKAYSINDETKLNTYSAHFDKEDNAQWSVWGKDQDGYLIPPLYEYPIYIRETPFAAPKLNKPILIEPQPIKFPKSSWLLDLFMPIAYADSDKNFEALFSWQPIDGANMYWLEISESSDFRSPILQTTTSKTKYIWRGIEKKKTYYWRVAAGNSSGRMGLFSEPEKVYLKISKQKILAKKKSDDFSTGSAIVKVKSNSPQKSIRKPSSAEKEKPKEENDKIDFDTKFLWRAGYSNLTLEAPTNVDAEFNGFIYSSFNLESFVKSKTKIWTLGIRYTQSKYRPDPEPSYVFQKDLVIPQAEVYTAYQYSDSFNGFGIMAKLIPHISRENFEAVKNDNHLMYGPFWQGLWKDSSFEYLTRLGALFSGDYTGGFSSHRVLFKPTDNRMLFGGEVEIGIYSGTHRKLIDLNGYLLFGFEF